MRMNRRGFFITASGALAFTTGLAGLGGRTARAAGEPIRIGQVLDKTGGLSSFAFQQINGAAMAVSEINAQGGLLGRPLEIVFYDTQSNNQLYAQYVTQALTRDKVSVIHGAITSSARELVRPIIRRFESLYFYNCLYEGGVCDGRTVSTLMVPSQQIAPLSDYVVKENGRKRAYILAADYNFGHNMAKWIQYYIGQDGGEVLQTEFFPLDAANFSATLARIQSSKPDAVWTALVGDAHLAFFRQFQSTIGKEEVMLVAPNFNSGRGSVSVTPDVNEGIVTSTSYTDTIDTPESREFVSRFKEFTGTDDYIGEDGEAGYRGVMLWARAVETAGSEKPDDVMGALGGTTFDGPSGMCTIERDTNHTVMNIYIGVGNRTGGYDVVKTVSQQDPKGPNNSCDLVANPDENRQFDPPV